MYKSRLKRSRFCQSEQPPMKRQRCCGEVALEVPRVASQFPSGGAFLAQANVSVPKLSTEEIYAKICSEIKTLPGRKRLPEPTVLEMQTEQCGGNNAPLFTLSQMMLICKRMLQDQEQQLFEEYNDALMSRLAEQYDVFVKFTYDQIQRQFRETPSYLS